MSAVEAYLADLRAALGDRLPPAVTAERLREASGHLLASAEEVGGSEALRRYGRPRAVADGLVRAHRGYDERSAWRLALPTAALSFYAGARFTPHPLWLQVGVLSIGRYTGRWALLGVAAAFVARVVQTRRWIAVPVLLAHASAIVAVCLVVAEHASGPVRRLLVEGYGDEIGLFSATWLALNATGLGLGRLLDLRRTRRARGAR